MSEKKEIPAKDILKSIYYVIIALAITETFPKLFKLDSKRIG